MSPNRVITNIDVPNTDHSYLCLTFDDGPNPEYTPQILEILEKNNAKATFFVVGEFVNYHPQIVRQIVEAGHEIGNHTFSHPDLRDLSEDQIQDEIERTESVISAITGSRSALFRPTYGLYDSSTVSLVERLGYRFVTWSDGLYTRDWELRGVDVLINTIMTYSKNGSIVLVHDAGGNRDQTVEAVKFVIPELMKKGFQFVTVSDLLHISENIGPGVTYTQG